MAGNFHRPAIAGLPSARRLARARSPLQNMGWDVVYVQPGALDVPVFRRCVTFNMRGSGGGKAAPNTVAEAMLCDRHDAVQILRKIYASLKRSLKSNTCPTVAPITHNLIHTMCAEIHRHPIRRDFSIGCGVMAGAKPGLAHQMADLPVFYSPAKYRYKSKTFIG